MVSFTLINLSVRKKLNVSLNEYTLLEIVYLYSHTPSKTPGWCSITREYLAENMRLTKRAVLNIIERIIDVDLLIRDSDTKRLKTTHKWNNTHARYYPI